MRARLAVGVVVAVAAAGLACGPAASPEPRRLEDERLAMGSVLRLTAWTVDEARARAAFGQVFADFERLDALLSVWRAGSDIQRLNAAAGQAPIPVQEDTRRVLRAAAQVSEWTGGGFDVTFGALADVWKFDHDQDNRVPTAAEIAARLPLVDYRQVHVEDGAGTASIARAGMRVHLGGIGKGYAVDRAVAILRAAGLQDFMVQSGGDLYVGGTDRGVPWHLGIQDPRGPANAVFATLDVSDATFSTSGDYERFFEQDGVRYHHILDLTTGQPARGCRSVTVVARQATIADGLSTGIFVLGPEKGMALVERLPDVEAVIVSADNRVLVSSGLRQRLSIVRAPTP
jgi:thiamine biosynthesis lipoprotein